MFNGKVILVQAMEALRITRGWGFHIRLTAARLSALRAGRFLLPENSWYLFLLEAESTPGP
jgi:hypothetical protein